jgi:DNA-binding transcriptional regulator YiaG
MSNIATALSQEITRLARREARSLSKPLHKAVAQFRRNIAELKRQNSKSHAEIVRLQRQVLKGFSAPTAEAPADKVRYSAASVKSQRKRLGMSADAFAKLIGVTGHTVYAWEQGKSRPRSAQIATFGNVRSMGKTEANARLEALRATAPKSRKKPGRK